MTTLMLLSPASRRRTTHRRLLLAALGLSLALFSGAAALADPRAEGPGGAPGAPGLPPRMNARSCADMPAHTAGWLGFAEAKLGISGNQAAAWAEFRRTMLAAEAPMQKLCADQAAAPAPQSDKPDASRALERQESLLSAQLEAVKLKHQAVNTLLPKLDPPQRDRLAEILPPFPLPPVAFQHAPQPHPRMEAPDARR